jgi:hypothetical protein
MQTMQTSWSSMEKMSQIAKESSDQTQKEDAKVSFTLL